MMRIHIDHRLVKSLGRHERVRIQQQNIATANSRQSLVVCAPEPDIAFVFDQFRVKEAFAQFLHELICERGIELVAEEARHGEESIALRLCADQNWRYENIEMFPEERRQRNIPRDYADNPNPPKEEKERCNREREQYMCDKVLREGGQLSRILVICGRLHTEPIAALFRRQGHQVETADIQQQNWYIEDWIGHFNR